MYMNAVRFENARTGRNVKMKSFFVALLIFIGLSGAATDVRAQPATSVSVKIGTEKAAGRANIRVKFLEMIEDSRCPRDVQCIQAGNARVRVRVSRNGRAETLVLNTSMRSEPAVFAGYRFELTALTPEPGSNIRINRNGYVAPISVKKA
jgi:hypothetical protein